MAACMTSLLEQKLNFLLEIKYIPGTSKQNVYKQVLQSVFYR